MRLSFLPIFCGLVLAPLQALGAEETKVLGCGGFIKSGSKSIDFSLINLQLLSKEGSLKHETDCAPNNGYYFIPVYEKGEYILKVVPPLGWKFSPEEVILDINGQTDDCTLNKDINFVFAGFGVIGKVVTMGEQEGPAGVKIDLLSGEDDSVVQSTYSMKGGRFVFSAVPGSNHKVRASHPKWSFAKTLGQVSMTGDNGQAEDLVVSGFDVSGKVFSGSHPSAGVTVALYGSNSKAKELMQGCQAKTQKIADPPKGLHELCQVVSDSQGTFTFPVVPRGSYKMVSFYKGEKTKFEVSPAEMDLTVELESVSLSTPFTVEGFSVHGITVTSNGKVEAPLAGVTISLSGPKKYSAKTDNEGKYYIEKLESGNYVLTGFLDGIEFLVINTEVFPNNPVLPKLSPSSFRVSGQLDFSTVAHDKDRILVFTQTSGKSTNVLVSDGGQFSTMLAPGGYSASVKPSETDRQMGIVFAPLALDVMVTDKPVNNLYFSPVRVTVSGKVTCIDKCPSLSVVLKSELASGDEFTTVVQPNGGFSFQNQLPGKYSISVDATESKEGICWDKSSISFNIESSPVDNLVFTQTGWVMRVHSSHETVLQYTGQDNVKGELDIPVGPSQHCLPTNKPLQLKTQSCHVFQKDAQSISWNGGETVSLRAERHAVTGRVTAVQNIADLQVLIHTPSEGTKKIELKQPDNKDGLMTYRFSYHANSHEEITVEPLSNTFLLSPTKLHIQVGDECQLDSAVFTATKGLFVTGQITPPLKDVLVTVKSASLQTPAEVNTDASGRYSLGPFHPDLDYTVTAEKIGFVITDGDKKGNFKARKLASIQVEIVDQETKEQLQAVVVSLSGGENNYRTNQQTGVNGSLSFLGLSPGEYFLKPILKEYEFEPKSKLISVQEGGEEIVQISGKRIAFSVFGSVTGLKGDPESGVVLEAVGQGPDCSMYQEETVTGDNGKYRLRGLQPNCNYQLKLKGTKDNVHVERTIPTLHQIKIVSGDVKDISLIALRPRTTMDVSLMVKVKNDNPNVKNIKAKLFCSGAKSDTPLHTVKMDVTRFVIFPSIPSDGKECWISVEANAVQVNQRVKNQRIDFLSDKAFEHHLVELELESSLARGEIGQTSWATLPLVIILLSTLLYWEKVSPTLVTFAEQAERVVTGRRLMAVYGSGGAGQKRGGRTAGGTGGGGSGGAGGQSGGGEEVTMSQEDIDKAVKYVEASTRAKKKKPAKI